MDELKIALVDDDPVLLTELPTVLAQQGITVIMITHDPDIASHAQRTIWIRDGLVQNQ